MTVDERKELATMLQKAKRITRITVDISNQTNPIMVETFPLIYTTKKWTYFKSDQTGKLKEMDTYDFLCDCINLNISIVSDRHFLMKCNNRNVVLYYIGDINNDERYPKIKEELSKINKLAVWQAKLDQAKESVGFHRKQITLETQTIETLQYQIQRIQQTEGTI